MRNTGVQEFLITCQLNTRQWKRTGSVTQQLNENVSDVDGDGEKIRPYQAKSKVGTRRHAGKLGDVKYFTRKSTRDIEGRWET